MVDLGYGANFQRSVLIPALRKGEWSFRATLTSELHHGFPAWASVVVLVEWMVEAGQAARAALAEDAPSLPAPGRDA